MTHGRHVTREECASMRDYHERGYFIGLIAQEHDVSEGIAKYHIYGKCAHQID